MSHPVDSGWLIFFWRGLYAKGMWVKNMCILLCMEIRYTLCTVFDFGVVNYFQIVP